MPGMEDPAFHQTVSLICQHNENGAMGVVVNRLAEYTMGEVYQQLDLSNVDPSSAQTPVYLGGPVHQEMGLVLHEAIGRWESTLTIDAHINLTSSKDILGAIANGSIDGSYLFTLGYASWLPGQIEEELQQNTWLTVDSDAQIIFKTPIEQRWHKAIGLLGIDSHQISTMRGHD